MHDLPHKIKVLVSKDLGKDELVVGLEDLKDLNILHKEFPKTLPEWRTEGVRGDNVQYNSIRGDQWNEQREVKEKRERARGFCYILRRRSPTSTSSLRKSRWSWTNTSMYLTPS